MGKTFVVEESKNEPGQLDLVLQDGDQAIETMRLCKATNRAIDVLDLQRGIVQSNMVINVLMSAARTNTHISTVRARLIKDIYGT